MREKEGNKTIKNYRAELTGVFGDPVDDNPTGVVEEAAFAAKGLNYRYLTIRVQPDDLETAMAAVRVLGMKGINLTMPHKVKVLSYLDELSEAASIIGAVNTVIHKDGRLYGENTDGKGFVTALGNAGIALEGKRVTMLGAGGAGRSAAKKLLDCGAEVYIYDKSSTNAKTVASEFEGVKYLENINLTPYYAVINATGVGMHKTEGVSPVGKELILQCEIAVDLIYVPETSEFLRIAKELGKKTVNGEAMLFYQAYYADCVFFFFLPSADTAKAVFEEFLKVRK